MQPDATERASVLLKEGAVSAVVCAVAKCPVTDRDAAADFAESDDLARSLMPVHASEVVTCLALGLIFAQASVHRYIRVE